jgi:hypothetical protein
LKVYSARDYPQLTSKRKLKERTLKCKNSEEAEVSSFPSCVSVRTNFLKVLKRVELVSQTLKDGFQSGREASIRNMHVRTPNT